MHKMHMNYNQFGLSFKQYFSSYSNQIKKGKNITPVYDIYNDMNLYSIFVFHDNDISIIEQIKSNWFNHTLFYENKI